MTQVLPTMSDATSQEDVELEPIIGHAVGTNNSGRQGRLESSRRNQTNRERSQEAYNTARPEDVESGTSQGRNNTELMRRSNTSNSGRNPISQLRGTEDYSGLNRSASCHIRYVAKIESAFQGLGKLISRRPWTILTVVILMNCLLGIGMLQLESDTDISRIYTPMNSQADMDMRTIGTLFPDESGTSFYDYQATKIALFASVLVKPYDGNILNSTVMDEVQRLYIFINDTVAETEGSMVELSTVCAITDNRCSIKGGLFLTAEFQTALANNNVSYPVFTLDSGALVDYSSLVSNPVTGPGGMLASASLLKIQFNLRSDTEQFKTMSVAWQNKVVERMASFQSPVFDFAYSHSDSLGQELTANIGGDIALFSVTFTLMITYACFATYSARHDCVGQRMFLAYAGVLAAGLAIVASFGLVSACGMDFVDIVGNAPFLILGIGVDDMFILLAGLAGARYGDASTEERIGWMMKTSGVAITITSLTDLIAFAAGASSSFKSVRNFSVFTGVAVIFCYINQTLMFSSCLAINETRVEAMRHFACCWKKTESKEDMEREDAKRKCKIICCAGSKPTKREDVESYFELFARKVLLSVMKLNIVKGFVMLLFMAYLGVSIWGATKLEQGLVIKNLVSDDSYFYKFSDWEERYLPPRVPVSFVFPNELPYHLLWTRNQIRELVNNAQNNPFVSETLSISWLESFENSSHFDDSSAASFIVALQTFFAEPGNDRFRHDVLIDGNQITASRMYVFINAQSSSDQGQLMLDLRDLAAASPLSAIAYSPAFIFYEQYVAILPQTLQTLGAAVGAVFLVTAFFMPHPLLLLYVVVNMAMILVGVVGFMYFWGLTLSSITMIHLIMCVGFSVDFTAHICHAFMVAGGVTRNDKVKEAIANAGGPILNGAISSCIGILMLSIAKSYIFQSFFQIMLLVILFGLAHAVLFLPVLLSLIGPMRSA